MAKIFAEANCSACSATGLYHGFAEPPGVAVVCLRCKGSGKTILVYEPFTGRKTRDDIRFVFLSKGLLLGTGVGPVGKRFTYKEFLAGKLPVPD